MTVLLALDSACASCSAAVWDDQNLIAQKFEPMGRGQSENLMPFVEEVMHKADKAFSDVDLLAVTVGPGAFTGIRICLSAARALSLALKKPLIGITTMEALVAAQALDEFEGTVVAVIIETKRQDLYVQLFDADRNALTEAMALLPQEIEKRITALAQDKPVLLCGDGAARFVGSFKQLSFTYQMGSDETQPDAAIFGALALAKFRQAGPDAFAHPPAPIYLRPPDATPPKPKFLFKTAG